MRDEVLIIGAGPSGLFAAAELIRHGVKVRLIEREVRMHREARATTIQAGTLEILDSVGLLAEFMKSSEHVRRARIYGPEMEELRSTTFEGIDCRCQCQCVLPQYETERILETHLESLGGSVERGVTATQVDMDGSAVVVELRRTDGELETVKHEVVIGAGGAHSVTRSSMNEALEGDTYEGHFLVADIAMEGPFPRDENSVVCGAAGLLLLAPMPGGGWISFQDFEETAETVSAEEVLARIEARVGGRCRPTEVSWYSPFRMHRRMVSRLTDGHRFLIGDAAHLSSPFGGEGLNAGLHDAHDLAWKLGLVLRGEAGGSLLDGYLVERAIADRHVLEVSDQVHCGIVSIANTVRERRAVAPAITDPFTEALVRNARAMLDMDYCESPLVADYGRANGQDAKPHAGQRYADWIRFGGKSHHVLVFGDGEGADALERLGRRWSKCVKIARNPEMDAARAGVPGGGTVLIRPDGHIGFRFPSADGRAFAALEWHLSSYLV